MTKISRISWGVTTKAFTVIALVNFDVWMDALSTTMQGRDQLSSDVSSQHISSNFREIQNFIESLLFTWIISNHSQLLVVPSIKLAFLDIKYWWWDSSFLLVTTNILASKLCQNFTHLHLLWPPCREAFWELQSKTVF